MRRWSAHALVLTLLAASAIVTSRVDQASVATADLANTNRVNDPAPVAETRVDEPVIPTPDTAGGFSANVERWRGLSLATSDVVRNATGVSLDEDLLLALVDVESGGDPGARSRAGAVGLTQVEPATFRDLQSHYPDVLGSGWLAEPRTNLVAGGIYLADCTRQLHADLDDPSGLDLVLKAYNLGPRAAAEWRATGTWVDDGEVEDTLPIETVEHSTRIVAGYQNIHGHALTGRIGSAQ